MTGGLLQEAHHLRGVAAQQRERELQALGMRDRLQAQAARAFAPTTGLSTLIHVDGTLSRERFALLIERSVGLVPFMRSVVAAPDDVARYVYPLAGNERVLNLDYRQVPVQWQQIQEARARQSPMLFAPVKLVQGGLGVIQRTPVFVHDPVSRAQQYWGVISVVVDLEQLITAAGIAQDDQWDTALFAYPAGGSETLVWGAWPQRDATAVTVPVELPGGRWVLRTRPHENWAPTGLAPEAMAVWLGGSIVALLVGLLVRQSNSLRRGNAALSQEMLRTQQVQADLELSRAESQAMHDRLQSVLDAATEVAIIATDVGGHITVFNRGAERMLGYTADEVRGGSPALWHIESEIAAVGQRMAEPGTPALSGFAVFAQLAQTRDALPLAWTFVTRSGAELQVSLALSTVRAADGSHTGYLGVARDLTAQKRAETELHQLTQDLESRVELRTQELRNALQTLQQAQEGLTRAEKLAALGSLVAGMAHELNTPIGNCLITASTLQEHTHTITQSAAKGEMRKSSFDTYLQDMQQGTDILMRGLTVTAELVQHFKQLAVDQTSEQRRLFQLGSVVDDVVTLSKAAWKGRNHRIEVVMDLTAPFDSYPGALGRVLSNLMQNALLHGFEGRTGGHLRISARALNPLIAEIVVEDDGVGMSEDVRRRAFDPFFTTKLGRGGSGLGLNIVYNTVTGVLGGTVDIVCAAGQPGTRFVLRIPMVAPQSLRDAPASVNAAI
ncbi:ATP-binding protein [Curvibacter sp. APW13]|uniref:ATP-binding protein n=1 Tax=Curvibacter sp. APW13 TaxID=3077236 RepID=UPI0028DE942A|nr:ATP-binding protein [Curvibacter sp. APW13]MDT8989693.1 ATP-binding protein [Curvibacter sp. APW13]